MKGFRRVATLLLIPLLVALLAAPVAAAPGNGAPKTNEEHPSWLELDAVAATVSEEYVTLSGRVSGNFDMTVANGAFSHQFVAKGHFSVQVPLSTGLNFIKLSGVNNGHRLINTELVVTRRGGSDSGGGGSTNPVPTRLYLEVGQNTLIANGASTMSVRAIVLDENGDAMVNYANPITFSSSNPNAVTVVTSQVVPVNGIAVATLRAGTVSEPAVITAQTAGLAPMSYTLTPAPQAAGSLAVTAASSALPVGSTSLLQLQLKDSAGMNVYTMTSPLWVQLTSSNPAVVSFQNGSLFEYTMTQPSASVSVTTGTVRGTVEITGAAILANGTTIPVQTVILTTVLP